AGMLQRLTERKEWKFFSVLPKAAPGLALAWWLALLLRGALPAAFAIAMGVLVGAVQRGDSLAGPLALVGTIFVLLQILSPIHQAVSANLGDRASAWAATHWLLRESAVWRDRNTEEVRGAQRDADYAYRLAVDPPKELRLFGLVDWTMERFIARRTRLHELQYAATRLRERPLIWSLLLVVGANIAVFWALASSAANDRITLAAAVVYMQSAV